MISFLKQYAEKYSHVKGNIYTAEIPKISNEFLTYEFLPWKKVGQVVVSILMQIKLCLKHKMIMLFLTKMKC